MKQRKLTFTKVRNAYNKGFKAGYNNPGNFNQAKLLASNTDLTRGVIDGICARMKDIANGSTIFILK